ncbi:hypothetical protein BLS_005465 [Venturia inaequalis]|uniref:BTB domain-containing protein n=1 Tax=Venturia inaequalis TaxID=5025 RepID=A0A8H3UEM3_VENIN|nr:hypothetical protein BLS_005465 [Venturia inaequalis]
MKNQACKPPKKGHRLFNPLTDQTIVTITVGQGNEAKAFLVAREHLISASDYFANAFNGIFREAADKKISLADVESKTFGIFIQWLQGRTLLDGNGKEYDAVKDKAMDPDSGKKIIELLNMYVFGDEYDVPQFRRDVIDTFIDYQEKYPSLPGCDTISQAYERLPASSPMLQFLVDSWAFSPIGEGITNSGHETLPRRFLVDTMLRLLITGNGSMENINPYMQRCDYHEHNKIKKEE